jgi:F-type H+-transporting ATPase subunit delta
MTEGSVARRYARAFLELARESDALDRVEADLTAFLGLFSGELGDAMSNPVFTQAERRAVLDAVLARVDYHPYTLSFLRLLLDKDRMDRLVDVHREFRALADTEAGRVRATVTTAFPMDAALTDAVRASLSATTGKDVVISTRVDPALLGGMVAQVGSRVFDASLRTRLDQLQLSLAAPARA